MDLIEGEYCQGDYLFLKYIGMDTNYPILCDRNGNVYCNQCADILLGNVKLKLGQCAIFEVADFFSLKKNGANILDDNYYGDHNGPMLTIFRYVGDPRILSDEQVRLLKRVLEDNT